MSGNVTASTRTAALTVAIIVAASAITAVPGLVVFTQQVAADSHSDPPSTFAVAQGPHCYEVTPIVNENQTVEEFYDYRRPNSYGTIEYQEPRTTSMFFYHGPNGTSLVVVHAKLGGDGYGSTISWDVSGLPAGWELAVRDDHYNNGHQDDDYALGETTAHIDWKYWGGGNGNARTDGAAFWGLQMAFDTIVIDPGYNEEADFWGDWGRSGAERYRILGWKLKGAGGETVASLALDGRVFIHKGGCLNDGNTPTAAIDDPADAMTGNAITFDASESGNSAGYAWDFDDDGEIDAWTEDPTVTHRFDASGTYTVTVYTFDTYGNENTASTTITISNTAPTATLSAPDSVRANETVRFDASGSTDNAGIVEYRWDLDGDGEIDRTTTDPTTEYAYRESGNYTVTVTVVDADGATDSASANITVANRPPSAALSVPNSAPVNESVTLDASGSTDNEGIVEYRWDFDGNGTIDETTQTPTVTTTYTDPGEYEVRVTVVDTDNATDTATATLTVEPDDPPEATLSAPENATAGVSVTFDATGSTDDAGIVEYRWDFDGDGTIDTTTTAPKTEFTYTTPGTYNATVTVVDDDTQTDNATTMIVVTEAEEPLVAVIDASATDVVTGETVTFDGSRSTPADRIVSYEWTFGDGATATGTTVEHTYDEPGTYDVTLRITGADGETATTTIQVSVAKADDGGGSGNGGDGGNSGDGGNGGGPSGGSGGGGGAPPSDGDDDENTGGNGGTGGGSPPAGTGGGGPPAGTGGGQPEAHETPEPDPEPEFELSSATVTVEELVEGEPVTFSVTVTNTGTATGTKHMTFAVDGTTLLTETVELAPHENTTVTFIYRFGEPGTHTVALGDAEPSEIHVLPAMPDLSVTDLSVADDTVRTGNPVRFTATVRNTGHAPGTMQVELELFGEVVAIETVSVPPSAEQTVTFTRAVNAPGRYTASVAEQTVTVHVVEGDSTGQTDSTPQDTSVTRTPGFTVFTALLALLSCIVAIRIRRER